MERKAKSRSGLALLYRRSRIPLRSMWATERHGAPSQRPRIGAPVDQEVLAGDVAGVRRAQEGAGGAELGGLADALGRHDLHAFLLGLLQAYARLLRRALQILPQAIVFEHAAQPEGDRQVLV